MMEMIYESICLGVMLVCGVLAVTSRRLLRSALWLAAASVGAGIFMYLLGAVWAAIFEISVCSGLVTVIFISAISLSQAGKPNEPEGEQESRRVRWLPLVLIGAGILLVAAALAVDFSVVRKATVNPESFREIFWNTRKADIWAQIVILLTGAVAIGVFFRERD